MTFSIPINGVIFDLDGTLINTLSAIGNAFNLALEEQGWDQHPLDRFATFIGSGARVAASRALPEAARVDDTIDRLVARQRDPRGDLERRSHRLQGDSRAAGLFG